MNNNTVRIPLQECPTGGCGAKVDPAELAVCLAQLPRDTRPELMAGFGNSEDAAVYRLTETNGIVSTVDFFPPMVDDPRTFGRIAAANAVSDVYAMGGEVLFALNLVCFPEKMDKAILQEILSGGAEKVREAGGAIAGGHSIYDHGLKYGLAVTGRVHPERFFRNNACQEGDCLILTKPLGTGLVLSAARAEEADVESIQCAVASMEHLNKYAAEKLSLFSVHAVTDVTGFGFMLHASEMAGSDWTMIVDFDSIPLLPGALGYAEEYLGTAAGQRNRNHAGTTVNAGGVSAAGQEILFDPQTSGGLLISVSASDAQALCDALRDEDPEASIVGQVTQRGNNEYVVLVV